MGWMSKSIRNRLIVVLLLSVGLPMLVMSILSYTYSRNIVRDMMLRETQTLFDEGKHNIEFYFDIINRASLYVYRNQYREQHLSIMLTKTYNKDSERFFYDTLTSMKEFEEDILQVYLYLEGINRSYLLRNFMVSSEIREDGYTQWDKRAAYITKTHLSGDYSMNHMISIKEQVLTFQRNIYDIPTDNRIGQVSIDVDAGILERLCGNLSNNQELFYLIDREDGTVLYASDKTLVGQVAPEDLHLAVEASLAEGNNIFDRTTGNAKHIVVVNTIEKPYMSWMMVKEIPQKQLNGQLDRIFGMVFLMLIITTVIIVTVSVVNSYYFTRPINTLLSTIRRIRKGDLAVTTDAVRKDEFGELQYQFNDMMEAINEHIDKEYKLAIENTSNELKALQGQINSHFMNNILQSIGTESLKSGNTDVYELVVQLGNMMQYAMRNQQQLVNLEAEMNYCISYLKLQKHRFGDAFNYTVNLPDTMKQVKVPKLLLQPIVENCFVHGFKETKYMGEIRIDVVEEDGKGVISITDNGKGMESSRLAYLNDFLKRDQILENTGYSIGLKNVYKRVKFYYRESGTLVISSEEGEGTTVQLSIPMHMDLSQWEMIDHKEVSRETLNRG